MIISRKQLVVLTIGSLALLALISLMALTPQTVSGQAAEQENPVPTATTSTLSGGNDCYCTYLPSTGTTPTPPGADQP